MVGVEAGRANDAGAVTVVAGICHTVDIAGLPGGRRRPRPGQDLVCVVSGAVAMLSRKRPGRHPTFGTVYFWALAAVFATAAVLAFVRWDQDHTLFVLGSFAFASAVLGREARRRLWPNWARLHFVGMGLSYILLLTAFYVDNGRNLPVWKDLPPIAYWLAPSLAGLPIILWAFLRHPMVRRRR